MARKTLSAAPLSRGVVQTTAYAKAQSVDVPGAPTRDRIDRGIAALLTSHPDAALIQSLPGMGIAMAAERIGKTRRFRPIDALAAAAGLTPGLRQSGNFHAIRCATSGDKALKRVVVPSAFAALSRPESWAFHERKRAEGNRRDHPVIGRARRRINVVGVRPITRQPVRADFNLAA